LKSKASFEWVNAKGIYQLLYSMPLRTLSLSPHDIELLLMIII